MITSSGDCRYSPVVDLPEVIIHRVDSSQDLTLLSECHRQKWTAACTKALARAWLQCYVQVRRLRPGRRAYALIPRLSGRSETGH